MGRGAAGLAGPGHDGSDIARLPSLRLGALEVRLHGAGAAFIPSQNMLIVADLHLEKATAYAARGQMLPPHDTLETLARLGRLVEEIRPERLVLLGDSFHSPVEAIGHEGTAHQALTALGMKTELLWIAGNHDPVPPLPLPGRHISDLKLGNLILRHAPDKDSTLEMVGHLHPVGCLTTRAGRQRRKCFLVSQTRLLLPAFGALTGGLSVTAPEIARWFPEPDCRAFLLCGGRLVEVPVSALT
jgi:uncharacterized protein